MRAEILQILIDTTLASSAAALIVGVLRRPMRSAVGAHVAYWLWILVPLMVVAILIPAPPPGLTAVQVTLAEQVRSTFSVVAESESTPIHAWLTDIALAIWAVGACAMIVLMILRQRSFVRALGVFKLDAEGLHRCDTVIAPMIVGVWNPIIVVPTDFELRYSSEERELVLAHEHAHKSRRDVTVNAIASVAVCIYWFNPLMHRALTWLRADQELACDAAVLSQRSQARRRYADALLKTQLATESTWRQSIGCHWQSIHPLKERISMLSHPFPGKSRRFAGLLSIATLAGVASYAAWAAQSSADNGSAVLIDLKVTITNPQTNEVKAMKTQYVVASGEEIKDANGRPLDFSCTPYLADGPGRSTDWSNQTARGIPTPKAGQILLECAIRQNGEVVERPAVIIGDGKLGTIETAESNGPHLYRFDISASTSSEKIAAAKKLSGNRQGR